MRLVGWGLVTAGALGALLAAIGWAPCVVGTTACAIDPSPRAFVDVSFWVWPLGVLAVLGLLRFAVPRGTAFELRMGLLGAIFVLVMGNPVTEYALLGALTASGGETPTGFGFGAALAVAGAGASVLAGVHRVAPRPRRRPVRRTPVSRPV